VPRVGVGATPAQGAVPDIVSVHRMRGSEGVSAYHIPDRPSRQWSVETPQTRYDARSDTTTSGRLPQADTGCYLVGPFPQDPGRPYRPGKEPSVASKGGDAPTLGWMRGYRIGSGASLRTGIVSTHRCWCRGRM